MTVLDTCWSVHVTCSSGDVLLLQVGCFEEDPLNGSAGGEIGEGEEKVPLGVRLWCVSE